MDVGLVCDGCRTFAAMGAKACVRCGAGLSLDPPGAPSAASAVAAPLVGAAASAPGLAVPAPAASAATTRACARCAAPVPVDNRFCGACGAPNVDPAAAAAAARPPSAGGAAARPSGGAAAGKQTMFFGAMQAARAKLVVIRGDGMDGVSFTLAGADHQTGRGDVPIAFEDDNYLSPLHANFFYQNNKLVVRDEGSVNGVFVRIRGSVPLAVGDRVLLGEQVIEVQLLEPDAGPEPDGTYFYASPHRASPFRLLQRLRGGELGVATPATAGALSLGREGNDLDFPEDPFISGRHAQVSYEGGRLTLTDLGSKNGTFLRVTSDTVLEHGDYVFMGQQLLRVEIV